MTDIMNPTLVNIGASSVSYFGKPLCIWLIPTFIIASIFSPITMFASRFIQYEYSARGYNIGVYD